jgi:hypothetical protein
MAIQHDTDERSESDDEGAGEAVLFCPACLYDLRGSVADACPECGVPLDRAQLATSAIPWVHRRGLGVRAFLKTAWTATFKTQLFCLEVARPVSLADARVFRRWVAVWLTVAALVFAGVLLFVVGEEARQPIVHLWEQHRGMTSLAAALGIALTWLFMLAFTGVHQYWFHPRGLSVQQQNRAVAVSHYACAPLVGFVPGLLIFAVGNLLGVSLEADEMSAVMYMLIALMFVGFVLCFVSLAAYLFVITHMARFAAHRSGPTRATLWLGLPVLWLLLGGLIFGILPGGIFAAGFMLNVI